MNLIFLSLLLVLLFCTLNPIISFINRRMRYYRIKKRYLNSGIQDIDGMNGIEFEQFLKVHFEHLGYHVQLTKTSNDYGADLILKKGNQAIAVQAKRYRDKVGIAAIQEIIGAIGMYRVRNGMVVTNSYFTKNAIALAGAHGIELWDRDKLVDVMLKHNRKEISTQILLNEEKICPSCNGQLVLKSGPYGEFYGCVNYPKCKYHTKKRGNYDVRKK